MTTVSRYASVEELKERLDITDVLDDQKLGRVLDAVSRLIDSPTYAGWRFHTTAADETRYFSAESSDYCPIPHGLVAATTVSIDDDNDRTYSQAWLGSDWEYDPLNAAIDGRPYTGIRAHPTGRYTFLAGVNRVRVVGKFGWPVLPDVVREATLIQSVRVFKRKDSPFGVTGTNALGALVMINKLDPDVVDFIAGVKREGIG
jgi:hypothetical protein